MADPIRKRKGLLLSSLMHHVGQTKFSAGFEMRRSKQTRSRHIARPHPHSVCSLGGDLPSGPSRFRQDQAQSRELLGLVMSQAFKDIFPTLTLCVSNVSLPHWLHVRITRPPDVVTKGRSSARSLSIMQQRVENLFVEPIQYETSADVQPGRKLVRLSARVPESSPSSLSRIMFH